MRHSSIFRFEKTAGLSELAKGPKAVLSLAQSSPEKAIHNAE